MKNWKVLHYSDCAVYNEPAYPAGECDCGAVEASQRWWTYLYRLLCFRVARIRSIFRTPPKILWACLFQNLKQQ